MCSHRGDIRPKKAYIIIIIILTYPQDYEPPKKHILLYCINLPTGLWTKKAYNYYYIILTCPQDYEQKKHILSYSTNLQTGLWTTNLTIEFITPVLYKISLTLLQALKSSIFFKWNNSVVIGHSSSTYLTDSIFFTNACHILWLFSVPWI